MKAETLNELGEIHVKAATECMAQLTRFVVRKQMTKEDAANLAWDLGKAFAIEAAKRLDSK